MPPEAAANNLEMPSILPELEDLNSLEQQLIALSIPFMRVLQLPKGSQKGLKGPVISVRSSVTKTTKVLPRPLTESQIVNIQLKRHLDYLGYVNYKMVNLARMQMALKEINPLYKDVQLDMGWSVPYDSDLSILVDENSDIRDTNSYDITIPQQIQTENCGLNDTLLMIVLLTSI